MNGEWQERLSAQEGIAERLRQELEAARAKFVDAGKELDRASVLARDIGLHRADGSFALRKATQHYHHALREYRAAVTRFTAFILQR